MQKGANKRIRKQRVTFSETKPDFNKFFEEIEETMEAEDKLTDNEEPISAIHVTSENLNIMTSHVNEYVSGETNQLDTDASENEEICEMQTATSLVCIPDNILLNIQNFMSEILERMDKSENRLNTFMAETKVKLDKIIQSSGEADVLLNNI